MREGREIITKHIKYKRWRIGWVFLSVSDNHTRDVELEKWFIRDS